MRIYITSRNRTPSSASPSDFQFALERPIELPEGAPGSIDSFHVLKRLGGSPTRCEFQTLLPVEQQYNESRA